MRADLSRLLARDYCGPGSGCWTIDEMDRVVEAFGGLENLFRRNYNRTPAASA